MPASRTGNILIPSALATVAILLSCWGAYDRRASAEASMQEACPCCACAPDFMQKGARLRGYTENINANDVIVRDVQNNWVLVELVLPKEVAAQRPDKLRWINVNTEKGFWSPAEPAKAEAQ